MKVVLDTNVLVSAFLRSKGKPAQILSQDSKFELLICEGILAELTDVLNRPRIRRRETYLEHRVHEYLERVRASSIWLTIGEVENIIPHDPPDNLVLACAVEGNADYLVSGNKHFLDLKQHRHVKMVTPAQFLEILATSKT
ncbi:MAG: putative toxin-antitoxin system toxin component, PIN family [Chloroflexi bacterium]|nr:putative toxin-antitoxin system toxin component, PIN family [Chloroflexota bacterium]